MAVQGGAPWVSGNWWHYLLDQLAVGIDEEPHATGALPVRVTGKLHHRQIDKGAICRP